MVEDRADTAGLADQALLVGPKRSTKRVSFDSCLLSTVITIAVNGDSKKETSATFYLDLFGLSSNAGFVKNRGLVTILNDD